MAEHASIAHARELAARHGCEIEPTEHGGWKITDPDAGTVTEIGAHSLLIPAECAWAQELNRVPSVAARNEAAMRTDEPFFNSEDDQ